MVKTDNLQAATADRTEINGYVTQGEQLLREQRIAQLPLAMEKKLAGPFSLNE